MYGSLRAEVSDGSAVVFGHFDKDAAVALLPREGLLEGLSGRGQLHCAVRGRTEGPGHTTQRGGETGRQHGDRQTGRRLRAVFEATTL